MDNVHAIVSIDHRSAKIVKFNHAESDREIVRHRVASHRLHHKAGAIGSGHPEEDTAFLQGVADDVRGIEHILIAGPGPVKFQFKAFLERNEADIMKHVVGVEGINHPTEPVLLGYARRYFSAKDRMTSIQRFKRA